MSGLPLTYKGIRNGAPDWIRTSISQAFRRTPRYGQRGNAQTWVNNLRLIERAFAPVYRSGTPRQRMVGEGGVEPPCSLSHFHLQAEVFALLQ